MADGSRIEWTEATWNPVVGCSLASPGCTHCYAMPMARRIEAMQPGSHYAGTTKVVNGKPVWTGKLALAPEHILTQPLRWRRPRRIFVNSMGDLFHEAVPDAWIDQVFALMALCPQHTFQVLTKRSARMRDYCTSRAQLMGNIGGSAVQIMLEHTSTTAGGVKTTYPLKADAVRRPAVEWAHAKFPNVWLGVSTEDQRRADERRQDMAEIAGRGWRTFVSYEPALGPVDWTGWEFLSWVISGGENGPRPSHPDWHRAARDFCAAHGIPYFFKQWGTWAPVLDRDKEDPDWRRDYTRKFGNSGDTRWINLAGGIGFHGERFHVMRRAGKKEAGRLLDGVEHNALPEARS